MANPESAARRKPRFRERSALKPAPATVPVTRPSPPPAIPRSRPRVVPSAMPHITVEQAIYALVIVAAFTLRIWAVGGKAMHGDEAEHAWFAWHLYNGTGYQYDPVYHGPFQFIVTAFFFFLFGVSDTTARLLAVLFGSALVCLPYFLRHYMGRTAALLSALYIAFSPAFVYVSRLERDDIFTCFFALTLAIALFSFLHTRRTGYIYVAAAAIALSLASMENTYITLFVFGTFVLLIVGGEYLRDRDVGKRLFAIWEQSGSPEHIDSRVLIGVGGLVVLALVVTVTTGLSLPVPFVLAVALIVLLLRQSMLGPEPAEGLRQSLRSPSRQQWLNTLTIVVAILFLAYSTFGTDLRGIWDSTQPLLNTKAGCNGNHYFLNPCRKDILGGLFYWLSQHSVHRGGQPWYYYILLFGLYEQIAVVFGLAGIVWFLRRPTPFTSFLIYWAILSFGIYSWAGEKFPWLIIHPLLPFALLASMFVAQVLQRVGRVRWAVLGVAALLALIELHNMFELNFVYAADPREPMVYVQSSPATPRIANDILALSNKVTNGNTLSVTIDSLDSWPFAWYLRDMPNVQYPAYPDILQKSYSSAPVIIVDAADQPALVPRLRGYTGHKFYLRWWSLESYRILTTNGHTQVIDSAAPCRTLVSGPGQTTCSEEGYKSLTWGSFARELINPGYWGVVTNWLVHRHPMSPKGGVWAYYYVKNGLASPY